MDSSRSSWRRAAALTLPLALLGAPAASATPAGVHATIPHDIAEREYRASASGGELQAPNRAHDLRTYFEPSGIRVHSRTGGATTALLSLSLVRLGRGETPSRVSPGEVTSSGARVEIARPGFVEWFENSAAGLEQGVTLFERPAGDGPLVVELELDGARASLHGDELRFSTSAGRQLRYAKLAAADAGGRTLDAHFMLPSANTLRLIVNDETARYPVVIDPLLTGIPDAQLESDQLGAGLGISVAGAGDVDGDGFDDVIVGASNYDAGQADEGAAFIFYGSAVGVASGNPATAATQLESDQANAYLGGSVAGAGDVNGDGFDDVIVGAARFDAGETEEGAAFLFLGSATGIPDGNPTTAAAWFESNQAGASMGVSVASAGDVNGDGFDDVIVGANLYDIPPFIDGGLALIFHGSAAGIADGNPASADTQLAGVIDIANPCTCTPPNCPPPPTPIWFGLGVASAGDTNADGFDDVIVGAQFWKSIERQPNSCDRFLHPSEGAAFLFRGSAAGVADGTSASAISRFEGNRTGSQMGSSASGAGDVNGDGFDDLIVGAFRHEFTTRQNDNSNWGTAFIFTGRAAAIPNGNPDTAPMKIQSDQLVSYLGSSVDRAGDVNGDGFDDVVVGAEKYLLDVADPTSNAGAAFVFYGSATGIAPPLTGRRATIPPQANVTVRSTQLGAKFAHQVAYAGDVNGDGAPDLIIGAPGFDSPSSAEGAAFVFLAETPVAPVPEPAAGIGLAAGAAGLALLTARRARRRRPPAPVI